MTRALAQLAKILSLGKSGGQKIFSAANLKARRRQARGRRDLPRGEQRNYRTVWISDVHLGTRGCKARNLLDFLEHVDADRLYLVGDIIDGWRLEKNWYWPQIHNDVVQKILEKAANGTDVIYIPGNHDETLRDVTPRAFGDLYIVDEAVHEMVDGRRFLVIHGDAFDIVVRHPGWWGVVGDHAHHGAIWLSDRFSAARRRLGYPHWSLSAYLKYKVKNALELISRFESAVARECAEREFDGVICGHIHHAEMREIGGVTYCNDGDWVEGCTALAENFDGRLELIDWNAELHRRQRQNEAAMSPLSA